MGFATLEFEIFYFQYYLSYTILLSLRYRLKLFHLIIDFTKTIRFRKNRIYKQRHLIIFFLLAYLSVNLEILYSLKSQSPLMILLNSIMYTHFVYYRSRAYMVYIFTFLWLHLVNIIYMQII